VNANKADKSAAESTRLSENTFRMSTIARAHVSVAMRRIGSIESHYNRPSGPSPYTMTGAGDVAGECTGDERGARWR
jgi:hypothetical protein